MKASTILPLLSAFATLCTATPSAAASPATDYQNSLSCGKTNPSINAAISAFCNPKAKSNDLFVPSAYASKGKVSGGAKVSIAGVCSPKQWVPVQYCATQFHVMCAKGKSSQRFGRGGCQNWKIETGAGSLVGVFKGN